RRIPPPARPLRCGSLVARFSSGPDSTIGIVLVLGALIGWMMRRALFEALEISRTASAIVAGDLTCRGQHTQGRSNSTLLREQSTACLSGLPGKTCTRSAKLIYGSWKAWIR